MIVTDGSYRGDSGAKVTSPFALGVRSRSRTLRATGRVALVAARFQPWGAAALLHMPAVSMVDGVVGMPEPRDVGDINRLTSWLVEMLEDARPADDVVARGVGLLEQAGGRVSVAALCRELNVGERMLQRRFRAAIGISPHRAARIVMFNEVRRRLVTGRPEDLATIAAELGYADHAHLARSFRQHFGISPAAFRDDANQRITAMKTHVGFVQAVPAVPA